MIKHIINTVLEKCGEELKFFDAHFEKGLIARLEELISHDFGRVTYTEAIKLLKSVKPGNIIAIRHVMAKGPDGKTRELKTMSIELQ